VGVPGVLGADSEAENVATFFQAPTLLKGVNANVEGFKREIRQHSVLHFAGHAVQQANGPGLVLTDGVFDASERKANQFGRNQGESRHLKLAVFSACNTAGSGYGSGSRTATLVAAFLDSGTQVVIASRWNVDSGATAEFMAAFYQKLIGEGFSASGALQSTAATVATDSRHSHPYYWAAFGQFVAN
jgi:CHAT domain-containing protein